MAEHLRAGTVLDLKCRGCGEPFTWVSTPGKTPIWCSDLCRKNTLYSKPCERCGEPCKGNSGGKDSRFCTSCGPVVAKELIRAAMQLRIGEVEHMWREGKTKAEIADALNVSVPGLNSMMVRWRKEGADLPYRNVYSAAALERMRANGRKRAAQMHAAA